MFLRNWKYEISVNSNQCSLSSALWRIRGWLLVKSQFMTPRLWESHYLRQPIWRRGSTLIRKPMPTKLSCASFHLYTAPCSSRIAIIAMLKTALYTRLLGWTSKLREGAYVESKRRQKIWPEKTSALLSMFRVTEVLLSKLNSLVTLLGHSRGPYQDTPKFILPNHKLRGLKLSRGSFVSLSEPAM